jgi:hypothetical protein
MLPGKEGREMIAERHNPSQHNLHANQAGNVEDCTSNSHSSQPWRGLVRFFATSVLASLVLNEIWEMAQMPAYVETAGNSCASTLGVCTWTAVGDVGIVLGIYEEGGKTILAALKPTTLLAMFDAPPLKGVAQEVEGTIVKIMKEGASG